MSLTIRLEVIPAKFRCFGCLHVRVGTIMLAVFQIVVHFVVIAVLTAALGRSTRFRNDVEYVALSISVMSFIQWERFVADVNHVPTAIEAPPLVSEIKAVPPEIEGVNTKVTLVTTTPKPITYFRPSKFFLNAGEEYVAIAVTLFSLLFSIMMLVGTLHARPYYLLPYCCIQFLDLFVTCLSVVGYYTYLPESGALARSRLWFSLLVVLSGIILLGVKAYLLAMVWLCYKFLTRYASGLESTTGLSLATDSCIGLLSFCRKCGCCECISVRPNTSVLSEIGPTSLRISTSTALGTPQSNEGHIIVLLRNPAGHTAVPIRPSALVPDEHYLPPKYEDVLAMPVGAFGPPPYSLITGGERLPAHNTNEQEVVTASGSQAESDVVYRAESAPNVTVPSTPDPSPRPDRAPSA